jgi:hypothetical protein
MPYPAEAQALEQFDPRTPQQGRTREQRRQAMDKFLSSFYDTDEATQAEIDAGIDQMLERIYSARSFAKTETFDNEGSDAA